MSKDRRQHTRVSFPQIRVKIPNGRKYREEFLRDLSAGGLFVSSTKILEVGSEVQIQVAKPSGDEPLALAGRVVRVEEGGGGKPIGMAVEFSELDEELSAEIAALITAYGDMEDEDEGGLVEESGEVLQLQKDLKRLRTELDAAQEETERSKKEALKSAKQVTVFKTRMEQLQAERDQLLTEKVGLETELESEQSTVKADKEIEAAQRETQKLRDRLKAMEQNLADLQNELNQHEADESVTRNLAERLAKEKQALEKKSEEDQKSAVAEIEQLRKDLHSLQYTSQEEIQELSKRLDRAEEELHDVREARDNLQQEISEAHKARVEAEARVDVLNNNLKTAKEQAEKAEELATQLRMQSIELEEARERAQWSEERAIKALNQLEQAKSKERDLRRLLAAVEGDEGVPFAVMGRSVEVIEAVPVEDPGDEMGSTVPVAAVDSDDGVAASARVMETVAVPAVRLPQVEVESDPVDELEFDFLAGSDDEDGASDVEARSSAEPGRLATEPEAMASEPESGEPELLAAETEPSSTDTVLFPANAIDTGADELEDDEEGAGEFARHASELDEEPPMLAGAEADEVEGESEPESVEADPEDGPEPEQLSLGPEEIASLQAFRDKLRNGASFLLTERFSRLEPVSRNDIQVSDWLKETRSFEDLRKAAAGNMAEDELVDLLHLFFKRSLIRIRA